MRFEQRLEIDAPPEKVWEACADPACVARFVGTEMAVRPAKEGQEPALDARYRVLMKLGAALVGGDVIIVDYRPEREFAWKAITGVDHRLRFRFRPAGGDRTVLTLRFSYDAPGLLGVVADVAAYPRVRSMLRKAMECAKYEIEHGTPPTPAAPALPARLFRELGNVAVLARSGAVRPLSPGRLVKLAWAARTWGLSLGTAIAAGAIRHPDRGVIIDEFGTQSYADADKRSDAIARGLVESGLVEGDVVAVLSRNHRGFLEAITAAAKAGADVLLLNTEFSGPQIRDVCEREAAAALIYDSEFAELVRDAPHNMLRAVADPDIAADAETDPDTDAVSLSLLAAHYDEQRPPVPGRSARITLLTSGTTGTPKGATRGAVAAGGTLTLEAPAALLDRIPLRAGMRIALAAPAFHAWGLANLVFGLGLGATIVMLRRFDPEAWLAEIERSRCEAFVVVPVMLQRILELPESVRSQYDTSSLQVVVASGSALPGNLATRWMDAFGDSLYNLYGSTEVANATIATPADLRAAPGTAGRPTRGTTVRLLDESGAEVPQGTVGRIFVGNAHLFEGYTGGGDKERVGGLMATGDLGRFDESGRLFVVGRDDEMIVSGGENVFPREVEDVISSHPAVAEVACVGIDDEKFGRRLRAFVVVRDGHDLSVDDVKARVREKLARFKVPRDVEFVADLPRNAAGKVVKKDLADGSFR